MCFASDVQPENRHKHKNSKSRRIFRRDLLCQKGRDEYGGSVLLKLLAIDPKPQGGVRDEVNLLAVHGVIAVVQLGRIVLFDHLVIACSLKTDTFDIFERNVLDCVGDSEPIVA